MTAAGWTRVDWWMRNLHLYTGLFLTPWMAIYATSALLLNHDTWFGPKLGNPPQTWEVVRQEPLPANAVPAGELTEQARNVLKKVHLDGPHRILSEARDKELLIHRMSPGGDYRIAWRRDQGKVVIQQQTPFSAARLAHSLHFRHGYDARYPVALVWALSVDCVIVSTWFWLISGVYIWARRPKKRVLGGACLAAGCLLFAGLVWLLRG